MGDRRVVSYGKEGGRKGYGFMRVSWPDEREQG